jgi:hypothetical protein
MSSAVVAFISAQPRLGYESFTETEIIALLQRLASKYLTDHEIISASRRKGDVGYSSELEPTIDRSGQFEYFVGIPILTL